MATIPVNSDRSAPTRHQNTFTEAMERLSRDDRFRATVFAMNNSPEEFEFQFCQFAQKNLTDR
jgi:hypothetical protein